MASWLSWFGARGERYVRTRPPPLEDKRLERLYDYTKFHIGIYLSIAGAGVALLGAKGISDISKLVGNSELLLCGVVLIVLASMAGGIIATSATERKSFDLVWNDWLGPLGIPVLPGRIWVAIEHQAFWWGMFLISLGLLYDKRVLGPLLRKVGLEWTAYF